MTREEFKDYLLNILPEARTAKGGEQIVCICPYCGDRSGHCYIGPFNDDTVPVMHNCFHCDPHNPMKSGIVNQNWLNGYNLWMPEGFNSVSKDKSGFRAKRITGRTVLDLGPTKVTDNKLTRHKLEYINGRLGTQLSYDDATQLKLVLNISDVLNGNEVKSYTRNMCDMETLDKYFIGAIGANNNMISLRNLTYKKGSNLPKYDLLGKKYVNYVVNEHMNTDKYYVIPTNLNTIVPVNIHVCEGFMDALGIFFNVLHGDTNGNHVVIAGFGKSYSEAVEYVLSAYPFVMANVHLYPDADVDDRSVKSVARKIAPIVDSITCHRNAYPGEKDYGVTADHIQDSHYSIM